MNAHKVRWNQTEQQRIAHIMTTVLNYECFKIFALLKICISCFCSWGKKKRQNDLLYWKFVWAVLAHKILIKNLKLLAVLRWYSMAEEALLE